MVLFVHRPLPPTRWVAFCTRSLSAQRGGRVMVIWLGCSAALCLLSLVQGLRFAPDIGWGRAVGCGGPRVTKPVVACERREPSLGTVNPCCIRSVRVGRASGSPRHRASGAAKPEWPACAPSVALLQWVGRPPLGLPHAAGR